MKTNRSTTRTAGLGSTPPPSGRPSSPGFSPSGLGATGRRRSGMAVARVWPTAASASRDASSSATSSHRPPPRRGSHHLLRLVRRRPRPPRGFRPPQTLPTARLLRPAQTQRSPRSPWSFLPTSKWPTPTPAAAVARKSPCTTSRPRSSRTGAPGGIPLPRGYQRLDIMLLDDVSSQFDEG